jgi:Zn-dependent peptidase ImmA (M78 family)
MENNNKIRELYSIYHELGHEVFEEKIKKPMKLYLHANSNVICMNSLNTIIANAMEKSKLG